MHLRAQRAVLGDMVRRLRPHRSAQASVQQVDMRLTQQLPVQVQRTASRARLGDMEGEQACRVRALVRVLLAGIR